MSFLHRFRNILAIALVALCIDVAHGQTLGPAPAEEPVATSEAEAVDALLNVLKDDGARKALVERLEAADAPSDAGNDAGEAETQTLARSIADFTKTGVEQVYKGAVKLWFDLSGIRALFTGLPDGKHQLILENGPALLGTVVTTIVIFLILSALFSRLLKRWQTRPANSIVGTFVRAVINVSVDALTLALAYACGYVMAISVFGRGALAIEQSLYLNAFLVAGAFRILIRIFVLPDRPEQAVFNFSPKVQRVAHDRLVFLFGFLTYGIIAVVPIANAWTSFVVGRAIRVVVVTAGAALALMAIRQISMLLKQEDQAEKLTPPPEPDEDATPGEVLEDLGDEVADRMGTFWSRVWPGLATVYVLMSYFFAIAQPSLMIDVIGAATLKSVVAAGFIALAFRFVRYSSSVGLPFPEALQRPLPGLKRRLDGFVPLVLRAFAFLLLVGGVVFLLDAWQAVDAGAWLAHPQTSDLIWRIISAALIAMTIVLTWAFVSSWIDHRLTLDLPGRNVSARARTLLALFRNAFTILVIIFGTMMALSQLGVDIAPLLAGAGVVGLAIGFGSQKLVQDIITGVFIQLENAFNEGDVVTVAGTTGTVEQLTIRSVGLRDIDGAYHIIPFSAVDTVSNYMRKFAYHVGVFGVAYDADLAVVKSALADAFAELNQGEHKASIIGDLEMHGVVALSESSVDFRVRIKTRPGKQWALGRAFTEIVKRIFDERGIEIPYPHRTLLYVPSKEPNARPDPAAPVESEPGEAAGQSGRTGGQAGGQAG